MQLSRCATRVGQRPANAQFGTAWSSRGGQSFLLLLLRQARLGRRSGASLFVCLLQMSGLSSDALLGRHVQSVLRRGPPEALHARLVLHELNCEGATLTLYRAGSSARQGALRRSGEKWASLQPVPLQLEELYWRVQR